jgi:2-deoxy-scyllo-inosamine dehydrogenase (SAM-dependent)
MGSIMMFKSIILNAKEKLLSLNENISNPKIGEVFNYTENNLIELNESDLFKYTNRVSIELSNLCNYSMMHKKCPINKIKKPIILPSKIVYSVINTLKRYSFSGQIAFHTYNEPLIDPRLFKFIEVAKESCPSCKIYICTNGYYLDQVMAEELSSIGVTEIHVSAYSDREMERLSKINVNIPFSTERMKLDERLNFYETSEKFIFKPCHAPLSEIIVTRKGKISLCCLDWKRKYLFGDLHYQNLEEILRKGKLHSLYAKLSKGERNLYLCRRCGWVR